MLGESFWHRDTLKPRNCADLWNLQNTLEQNIPCIQLLILPVGFQCHLIVFYVIRLLAQRWSWEGLGWWGTYMAAQKQTPGMEAAGGSMG